MIVKKILDSTENGAEDFADLNLGKNSKATLTYSLDGGVVGSTIDVTLYGRLPAPGPNTTDLSDYDSAVLRTYEWIQIAQENNISHDGVSTQGRLSFSHIYPQVAAYVTGNTAGCRVRVHIAYNEQQ